MEYKVKPPTLNQTLFFTLLMCVGTLIPCLLVILYANNLELVEVITANVPNSLPEKSHNITWRVVIMSGLLHIVTCSVAAVKLMNERIIKQ